MPMASLVIKEEWNGAGVLEEMKRVDVAGGMGHSDTGRHWSTNRSHDNGGISSRTLYCKDRPGKDNAVLLHKEMMKTLSCGGQPWALGGTSVSPRWQRDICPSLDPQCVLTTLSRMSFPPSVTCMPVGG